MRMKLHIAILSLVTIVLAGCANTETIELHTQPSVETIEEMQTMTESEVLLTEDTTDVSSVEDEEVVVINGFELVKEATVDLDGDGVEEEIVLKENELFIGADSMGMIGDCENFAIVDCDITDNYQEVMVPCDGSDNFLCFYRYNNSEIVNLGFVTDSILDEKIVIKGDGIIHAANRMDVHQWSNVYATHWIVDDDIVMTGWEENYIYTGWKREYPLLENLPVYAEKDRNSEKTIIEPQNVQFRRTDGKHWVEVVAEDGTVGWMYIEELYKIADCGNKDVTEVFKGTGYGN